MRTQEETEALVEHLEDVLQHLAYENNVPSGSCSARLEDVDNRGHLPHCITSMALIAIEEWREHVVMLQTSEQVDVTIRSVMNGGSMW
jgi:hypothetical protein